MAALISLTQSASEHGWRRRLSSTTNLFFRPFSFIYGSAGRFASTRTGLRTRRPTTGHAVSAVRIVRQIIVARTAVFETRSGPVGSAQSRKLRTHKITSINRIKITQLITFSEPLDYVN